MSIFSSQVVGAALLTVAVLGSAAVYFTQSLSAKPVHYSLDGVTVEQSVQTAGTKVVTTAHPGQAS